MPETPSVTTSIEAAQAAERAGAWDEALARYEDARLELQAAGDPRRACEVLRWIGRVHRERGEFGAAKERYEASLAAAEASGLRDQMAAALNCLGILQQARGEMGEAEMLYWSARELAEEIADHRLAAMVDQNLGTLANTRGDLEEALDRYRSALDRFRALGDDLATAWVLNNMGMRFADLGDWDSAERCYDEAFERADRQRDAATLGTIDLNRAELSLKRGRLGSARDCCDRAFEIFGRAGSKSGQAEANKFYGALYRAMEKRHLAASHLALAAQLAQACGDRLLEAESECERARLHADEDQNREALVCLNRAHRLFEQIQARREAQDVEHELDRLEGTYLEIVKTWAEEIESKDRYTAGHCERVADYTCALAGAVGVGGRDLTWLRMAALLHDVGKTSVPAEVLNKPGKLSADEWALMRRHTIVGDEIVTALDFPRDVRSVVRHHHEWWDGGGYPDGLAGEAIPLTARIVCIADVYDALTSARSYRPALSHEETLRVMGRDAGRVFDPNLFQVFHTSLARGRELLLPIAPNGNGSSSSVSLDPLTRRAPGRPLHRERLG